MVEGFIRWCQKGDVGLSQTIKVESVSDEDPVGLYDDFYVHTGRQIELETEELKKRDRSEEQVEDHRLIQQEMINPKTGQGREVESCKEGRIVAMGKRVRLGWQYGSVFLKDKALDKPIF